jgi:hypothetical protein
MIKAKLDVVDELHKIREELYEEEKNLNATDRVAKIKREANAAIEKYGFKFKRHNLK